MPDIGETIQLECRVVDAAGDLANATTVTCTVTLPDGTTATPADTNAGTGIYRALYTPATAGTYWVRWLAEDVASVSGTDFVFEESFTVNPSNDLFLSLAEAKDYLNLTNTAADAEVMFYLEVACDLTEQVAQSTFSRTTVTDVLSARSDQAFVRLTTRPVLSVSSVAENGSTLTVDDDYTVDTARGWVYRQAGQYVDGCWVEGRRNITVTYVAGYTTVPTPVRFAALTILGHLWENQRGVALSGRPTADDVYQVPGSNWFIPNKARDVLFDYRPLAVA